LCAVFGSLPVCLAGEGNAAPPNIIFIMSDDHAAHAIGAYGGRLAKLQPTPVIDRLAAEGMRFENCSAWNNPPLRRSSRSSGTTTRRTGPRPRRSRMSFSPKARRQRQAPKKTGRPRPGDELREPAGSREVAEPSGL
jgi:hypothetical protein